MTALPTEMAVLVWLTLLAASLWIPYIVGVNIHKVEGVNPFQRPHDGTGLPDWVMRANRAHINLLEQGLPFAILVLILNEIGGFTRLTAWTAIAFLVIRLAHAAGMITGIARMPLRPVLFTAGWVCCLVLGVAIFVA
ncbi:MAPEG family protein [Rhodobacterales bacterium HKCCE3408]|nr:MAPEG family protein [Rhodobacterales bacterium HKCCE3408]